MAETERDRLREVLKKALPAEYEAFQDADLDNLIERRFTVIGMLQNAVALKTLRKGPDPLPEALVCAMKLAAETGEQLIFLEICVSIVPAGEAVAEESFSAWLLSQLSRLGAPLSMSLLLFIKFISIDNEGGALLI